MSANHKAAPTGQRRPLRILVVEDSQPDCQLMLHALDRGGFDVKHQLVSGRKEMQTALDKHEWDLVLADHSMPGFSSMEALELVKQRQVDVPFIIVSGHIDEETAVAAMRSGAHDYVMKARLARLVPAVERELREADVRRARAKFEEALRRAHEELEMRVEQRTADLREANLKLQNVLQERRRLENEMLEIAENERRRIGFDLHDDLGQKLTGASFLLKGLERRLEAEQHPCTADARRARALVEEITNHTHNLARQFSSLDVQGGDLATVLKQLAANVEKMFDIGCTCSTKGTIPPLPQDTTVQLYKISQEAVSNSIKHGKATQVAISLARNEKELLLTIKNDGLPFAQPANRNRMGLRIMHYRASTIGATLDIRAQEKSGTVVTCSLSLKNGARHSRKEASAES